MCVPDCVNETNIRKTSPLRGFRPPIPCPYPKVGTGPLRAIHLWEHLCYQWRYDLLPPTSCSLSGRTPLHGGRRSWCLVTLPISLVTTLKHCLFVVTLTHSLPNTIMIQNAAMKSNLDSVFLRGHKWKWCSLSKYLHIISIMWRYCQRGVIIRSVGAGFGLGRYAGRSRKEALLPLCQRAAGLCWTLLQHLHPPISRGSTSRSVESTGDRRTNRRSDHTHQKVPDDVLILLSRLSQNSAPSFLSSHHFVCYLCVVSFWVTLIIWFQIHYDRYDKSSQRHTA